MAPIVKSLPSYIKDSQHALEIFRDFNFLGEDKLIFTMDISSLYTVIPNSEGLQALRYFFDQRTVTEPSSETLLRLAELILTLNCFSFAGNYYKQINGVAMGTKMGPSYAKLQSHATTTTQQKHTSDSQKTTSKQDTETIPHHSATLNTETQLN